MIRYLGDRVLIMQSLAGEEIASANIFSGRKHMWFKFSGLDQRYRASGVHTFMLDRAIYWACEHEYDYFMLGGGIEPGDSTYASKRGFSHLSACVSHIKKIHNEKMLNPARRHKKDIRRQAWIANKDHLFPKLLAQLNTANRNHLMS